MECLYGADRRDVVVGKKCGEVFFPCKQYLRGRVSELWGCEIRLDLHRQGRLQTHPQFFRNIADSGPPRLRVRAVLLPFQKCDLSMSMLQQVSESQARSDLMINGDVRHARHMTVAGHSNGRKSGLLFDGRIDGDETFDTSCQQHLRVGL